MNFYFKIILFILLITYSLQSKSQVYNDTLDVATWNLHYFGGDTSQHNQATNIKNVMNQMGADIYACEEVVNVDSFRWLAHNLNGNFGYYYSYYGSGYNVTDTNNPYYPRSLKYGFLYRKSMVGNITVRPFMKTSQSANTNFGGKFPFLVKCDIKGADNIWRPFYFVIVHAVCCPQDSNCNKRVAACQELKDSLDTYYPNDRVIVLGDFNDDIDTTICTNSTVSNYSYLVSDTINYNAITKPYSGLNIGSMIGFTTMIDHMIVSNEVAPYFVPNRVQIYKSYTWANTSDHHPVRAQFVIPNVPSGISIPVSGGIVFSPNPANSFFEIKFQDVIKGRYQVLNALGVCVENGPLSRNNIQINCSSLSDGLYWVLIKTEDGWQTTQKILVKH